MISIALLDLCPSFTSHTCISDLALHPPTPTPILYDVPHVSTQWVVTLLSLLYCFNESNALSSVLLCRLKQKEITKKDYRFLK